MKTAQGDHLPAVRSEPFAPSVRCPRTDGRGLVSLRNMEDRMRKLVLSCDGSLSAMQNARCAGWDGVFFDYRDDEQLRTSAAYAGQTGLFVQSIHAPFEDIWRPDCSGEHGGGGVPRRSDAGVWFRPDRRILYRHRS